MCFLVNSIYFVGHIETVNNLLRKTLNGEITK